MNLRDKALRQGKWLYSESSWPWIFTGRTGAESEAPILSLIWKDSSLEKTLMLGNIEGRKRRGVRGWEVGWHHRLNGHELSRLRETVKDRKACCAAVHGVTESDMIWTIIVTYGWLLSWGEFFPWHFLQPFILSPGPVQNSPPLIIFASLNMALGFCGQVRREEQKSLRKGNPFHVPKGGSRLTLRNELSEETQSLKKQETLLGRDAQAEARVVREPRRIALPCNSQARALCWWNWFPGCLWLIILLQGPFWWCMHWSTKVSVNKKASGRW